MLEPFRQRARRIPAARTLYYFLRRERHKLQLSYSRPEINPTKMVWIFCPSRSGSTWLRQMLSDALPSEVWEEPKIGLLFGGFYHRARDEQLASPEFVLGEPLRERWLASIRRFTLDTAAALHPAMTAAKYLVVKEPDSALGAPLLSAALPESRLVILSRDPRDVAASALDAARNWMDQGARARLPHRKPDAFVRQNARTYARQMAAALAAYEAHAGPKALVRYEDLRADALSTMRTLCADLSLPDTDLEATVTARAWESLAAKKGAGRFYRKASPGSYSEDLTPEQVRIVERECGETLGRLY